MMWCLINEAQEQLYIFLLLVNTIGLLHFVLHVAYYSVK
jgi:hypothetical protein